MAPEWGPAWASRWERPSRAGVTVSGAEPSGRQRSGRGSGRGGGAPWGGGGGGGGVGVGGGGRVEVFALPLHGEVVGPDREASAPRVGDEQVGDQHHGQERVPRHK